MNIEQLNKNLEKVTLLFSEGIRSQFKEGSQNPATESDINELARQTFYALEDFRKYIIEYLKNS